MEFALYIDKMPPEKFSSVGANAGLSRNTVYRPCLGPLVRSPVQQMVQHDVELHFLDLLIDFGRGVANSSLSFSLIRMPNARRP